MRHHRQLHVARRGRRLARHHLDGHRHGVRRLAAGRLLAPVEEEAADGDGEHHGADAADDGADDVAREAAGGAGALRRGGVHEVGGSVGGRVAHEVGGSGAANGGRRSDGRRGLNIDVERLARRLGGSQAGDESRFERLELVRGGDGERGLDDDGRGGDGDRDAVAGREACRGRQAAL